MNDRYIVRESILRVLREFGRPVNAFEIYEKLPEMDQWEIREEIWELTRANKAHITRDWKLEIV